MNFEKELDERLNPNIILPRLLEIFNENKDEGDNFTGSIEENSWNSTEIIIYNNSRECYVFDMPEVINEKYIITGGSITQCSSSKGSGTKNLQNIIIYGKRYNYDSFTLTDASTLDFIFGKTKINIKLPLIKLLTIGNTWYSQFGFENDFTRQIREILPMYIYISFNTLAQQFNALIDNYFTNKHQSEVIKTEFNNNLDAYLRFFNTHVDNTINININTKISDCFNKLISHMYTVCPNKNCPEDARETIRKIKYFMDFIIGNIFLIILSNTAPNIESFITFISVPSNFTNFINQILRNIEILHLNLKPSLSLIKIKGGRKTKRGKKGKKGVKKSYKNIYKK
jgi:hypothetical protein